MAVDADGRLRGVVTFEQVTRALRAARPVAERRGRLRAISPAVSPRGRQRLRDLLELVLGEHGADARRRGLRRTSSSTYALQSTIGRSGRRSSSSAAASKPSTRGIRASSTTASGSSASSCSSAVDAVGLPHDLDGQVRVGDDRADQESDVRVVVHDQGPHVSHGKRQYAPPFQ